MCKRFCFQCFQCQTNHLIHFNKKKNTEYCEAAKCLDCKTEGLKDADTLVNWYNKSHGGKKTLKYGYSLHFIPATWLHPPFVEECINNLLFDRVISQGWNAVQVFFTAVRKEKVTYHKIDTTQISI